MNLKITKNYMTNNDCYKVGQKILPLGVMIHSDACKAGLKANDWFNRWNKSGIEACVHAFVDDVECVEYLPSEKGNCYRGWHGGGTSNDTHIGFEMCEPTDYADKEYFNKIYKNAVEYTAYLLNKHGITEVNQNTVLCHCEGYKKGIATNHGDVMHWFKYHNKSMDDFRSDVATELKKQLCNVIYKAHIQGIGWQEDKKNAETCGTVGQSKRLEALTIRLDDIELNKKLKIQAHIESFGDGPIVQGGGVVGTIGLSKRIESIKIDSPVAIQYRVHQQSLGWTNWVGQGNWCGIKGKALRIEAIEIKLV